jgi:hypothetical protein
MGTSSFSGPIKIGPIKFTTGTTLGENIANVGTAVTVQSEAITQAASTGQSAGVYQTSIVIPAGSLIHDIKLYVTTAWTGAATTLGVGTTALATKFTAAGAVAGGTIGAVSVNPGTDATRTAAFVNVGTADNRIVITSSNTGSGAGTLVVTYVQPGSINP